MDTIGNHLKFARLQNYGGVFGLRIRPSLKRDVERNGLIPSLHSLHGPGQVLVGCIDDLAKIADAPGR